MITVEVTIVENERMFLNTLLLIDHNDYINYDMTEENVDKIHELLPDKYKGKLIIAITKIDEVIISKKENI